jgi:hypothetical protein
MVCYPVEVGFCIAYSLLIVIGIGYVFLFCCCYVVVAAVV